MTNNIEFEDHLYMGSINSSFSRKLLNVCKSKENMLYHRHEQINNLSIVVYCIWFVKYSCVTTNINEEIFGFSMFSFYIVYKAVMSSALNK